MNIDQKMIDDGYVSKRKHPEFNYYIYNYTNSAQYDQVWNETTLNCRGLILDEEGNIIARGMKKFFNYEEYAKDSKLGELPKYKSFEVYEKIDGSLGILYTRPDGKLAIATRGSFESEQAIKATELLNKKYPNLKTNPDLSYLFEIIYPENRIVVDYGKKEELVLLAILDNKSGEDVPRKHVESFARTWKFPIAKLYGYNSKDGIDFIHEMMSISSVDNKEGYVIQFDTGFRAKMKFDEYKRLHRMITGVSNKSIWDMLRNKQSVDELLDRVPDEFYKWVEKTVLFFNTEYNAIKDECKGIVINLDEGIERKEVAEIFKNDKKTMGVCFAMYDSKPYEHIIWKILKPKYSKPFNDTDNKEQ